MCLIQRNVSFRDIREKCLCSQKGHREVSLPNTGETIAQYIQVKVLASFFLMFLKIFQRLLVAVFYVSLENKHRLENGPFM